MFIIFSRLMISQRCILQWSTGIIRSETLRSTVVHARSTGPPRRLVPSLYQEVLQSNLTGKIAADFRGRASHRTPPRRVIKLCQICFCECKFYGCAKWFWDGW